MPLILHHLQLFINCKIATVQYFTPERRRDVQGSRVREFAGGRERALGLLE